MAAIHRPALPAPKARERPRSGRALLWAAGAVLVIVATLQVNQYSRLTSAGYEVQDLNRERAAKLAANHELEAEVASLSSLARVDWEARTRLKMEPAKRRMYIEVNQPVPDHQTLPTRFLASEGPAATGIEPGPKRSFLERVRDLLPF